MSRTEIANAIVAKFDTGGVVSGIGTVSLGRPAGDISGASMPWAIIGLPQPKWEPMTMKANGEGVWKVTTNANILIILGRKDMSEQDAQSAQLAMADKVRAAFSNDSTLGGLCDDCQLVEGKDNIELFKVAKMYPQVSYILKITEQVGRNDSAVA